MTDYCDVAEKALIDVTSMATDFESWKIYKSKKGVEISYRKSKNFDGNVFRFKTVIPAPFMIVWNMMRPPTSMEGEDKSWDKSIASYKVLKIISDNLQIGRVLSHSAVLGTVSAREFVDVFYTKVTTDIQLDNDHEDISWIIARSVKFPKCPVSKQYVRGTNYPTGYAISPLKSDCNKTKVEVYLDTDIGGMLPQKIVEAALPVQQINYLEGVVQESVKRWQQSPKCDADFISSLRT